MDPLLCLLPSPLLGAAVWAPVASELTREGHAVTLLTTADEAPHTPHDVVEVFVRQIPGDRPVVLVPHSNAGLYVPALTARRDVAANIFVDAGLPPASGSVAVTPPALYTFLEERADDDGLLPPWTQWWDEADVAPLFPNGDVRREVEADQRRLPLSYFSHRVHVPQEWDRTPAGYLAFGDTYAGEKAQAAARGWPVRTLTGHHLHMLVEPEKVALEISSLAESLEATS